MELEWLLAVLEVWCQTLVMQRNSILRWVQLASGDLLLVHTDGQLTIDIHTVVLRMYYMYTCSHTASTATLIATSLP